MKKKEKQVQIPFKTFIALIVLTEDLLQGYEIEYEKIQDIHQVLIDKLDAMEKRELYTKYKIASKARLEYIEKVGIHKDFRW